MWMCSASSISDIQYFSSLVKYSSHSCKCSRLAFRGWELMRGLPSFAQSVVWRLLLHLWRSNILWKINFDPDLQGVEKRRDSQLLLTEKGLGGSMSTSSSQLLKTRKPAWQVGWDTRRTRQRWKIFVPKVAAKEVHVDQGFQGVKWDSNWDKR